MLDDHYNPICMLNPYSMDFIIRGRVLKKDPMREYKNARGNGHVMSVVIMDNSDAPKNAIKGTFFNEQALKFDSDIAFFFNKK